MAEPSEALKTKAREWLAAYMPNYIKREQYFKGLAALLAKGLAALLAEVAEEECARISRHPAFVCCHEAAKFPEPEPLGVCASCEHSLGVIKAEGRAEERAAVVKWLLNNGPFTGAAQVERGDHLKAKP